MLTSDIIARLTNQLPVLMSHDMNSPTQHLAMHICGRTCNSMHISCMCEYIVKSVPTQHLAMHICGRTCNSMHISCMCEYYYS